MVGILLNLLALSLLAPTILCTAWSTDHHSLTSTRPESNRALTSEAAIDVCKATAVGLNLPSTVGTASEWTNDRQLSHLGWTEICKETEARESTERKRAEPLHDYTADLLVTPKDELGPWSYERSDPISPPSLAVSRDEKQKRGPQPGMTYGDAVAKGKQLQALLSSAEDCAQSQWSRFEDLARWGWTFYQPQDRYVGAREECVRPVLQHIYSRTGSRPNMYVRERDWRHSEDVELDGVTYIKTNGHYKNWYHSKAVFGIENYSPAQSGPEQDPPVGASADGPSPAAKPLPNLRSWSDVTFLQYQEDFSANMHDLQAVVRCDVTSTATRDIVMEALQKSGHHDSYSNPGFSNRITLQAGTEPVHAMIGIPNGKGVAWLLAQHAEQDQLGKKCVIAVHVWWTGPTKQVMNIWYELDDGQCSTGSLCAD